MYRFLILEPNDSLLAPYHFFSSLYPNSYSTIRTQKVAEGIKALEYFSPDLILLSTSFSPLHSLEFLEGMKDSLRHKITPLIFTIDWSKRLHRLLGTSWAGEVGVAHSLSSEEEFAATLRRLLH